jgi:Secretion system C-terminal sorting domain
MKKAIIILLKVKNTFPKMISLIVSLSMTLTGFSQLNGQFLIGGTANETASNAIQLANGDYLFYGNTASYGAGSTDLLVIRYDINFSIIWQKTFGGSGSDNMFDRGSLLENPDGTLMLLGVTSSFPVPGTAASADVLLFKLTATGNLIWSKTYGGAQTERASVIKQTSDGGYIIGGSSDSYNHPSSGATLERDLHLIKVDALGNVNWKQAYGTTTTDAASGTAATQIADVIQLSDNSYMICGILEGAIDPTNDAHNFIARVNSTGTISWFKIYTSGTFDGWQGLHSLVLHDNSTVIVTGATRDQLATSSGGIGGTNDGLILSVDINTGNVNWSKLYDINSGQEWFYKINRENANRYVVSIYETGSNFGSFDVGLLAIDALGNPIQPPRVFGTTTNEHSKFIEPTLDNGYLISGRSGITSFDAYLAKVDQNWSSGCGEIDVQVQDTTITLSPQPYTPTRVPNNQSNTITINSLPVIVDMTAICPVCDINITTVSIINDNCPGSGTGSFSITLDNTTLGVAPYTYVVSNGQTGTISLGQTITVSNLVAGTYTFTITDNTGACSEQVIITIGNDALNCCLAATDSQYVHINSNITYSSDVVWDNKYYIDDNVIVTVTNGAVLDITNVDVVFGECAGITFQDQAYLRSNNSVYRPCNVDGTWRGLLFDGSQGQSTFDNIINQSTFKNAEAALYFIGGADGVITDNLFSNCNNGVRVEDNNNFDHSITGNRFVVEQFYPTYNGCYPFTNNVSSYGVISIATKFSQQVSQNEFVNSKGTQLELVGIHQTNGGGVFTSNTFTDYTSSITSISPQFYTGIENNRIEVNLPGINSFFASTSIMIDGANGPLVEVNSNEINNNENQFPALFAVGILNATNVSVSSNQIEGFNYGVIALGQSHKYQITENSIQNALIAGIVAAAIGNDQNFISCNEITMKDYNNTFGLFTLNMSSTSEITSNCIMDCSTPMSLVRFGGGALFPLPKVRNNYLYNYNNVGINVVGHTGNIGTVGDPGMNTLWSNDNSAVDIQSNTNITVADNFGMFNIGFPAVQITSNNPYHSTASCANQIFNMPSQGNLNTNYVCDYIQNANGLLIGSGGTFALANNYLSKLSTSTNQYADANAVLATYDNADVNMLNAIIANTSLTTNETALLKYNFYYRNSDYATAGFNLNIFNPNSTDEADFKALRNYDLDVLANDWTILSVNDIQQIESIKNKKSVNANFAVSLLNNTATYRDHIINVPNIPSVLKTTNVKNVENVESYLNVYPNPSSSTVYIELVDGNADGLIQIFDLTGKLVNNYEINIVAGRIEIGIQNLNNGVYFITLTNEENGFLQKGKIIKIEG